MIKKIKYYVIPILSTLVIIYGANIIIKSVDYTEEYMFKKLLSDDGSMDSSLFNTFIQGTIQKYQIIGVITVVMGILTLVWGMFLLFKNTVYESTSNLTNENYGNSKFLLIIKSHKRDPLFITFLIALVYYIGFTFILNNYTAINHFFYNLGQFTSTIIIAYILSYMFYFITSVVPSDLKYFREKDMISNPLNSLISYINHLLKDLLKADDWQTMDVKNIGQYIDTNNSLRNVTIDKYFTATTPSGLVQFQPTAFEAIHNEVLKIENEIKKIQFLSGGLDDYDFLLVLFELSHSHLHAWIKDLYIKHEQDGYEKFIDDEFKKISVHILKKNNITGNSYLDICRNISSYFNDDN